MILVCLLITFFLNVLLSLVKEPVYRKLLSTLGGLIISIYAYGLGVIFAISFNMIGYVCMSIAPRKSCHTVTIFASGFFLTVGNYIR